MDQAARRARRADLAVAMTTVALGAFAFLEARKLPPSRFDPLGSGSFPLAISAMLFVLGTVALVQTLRGRDLGRAQTSLILGVGTGEQDGPAPRPLLGLVAVAAVLAYALALHLTPVGFFWATALFVSGLGLALGPVTPRAVAIALAVGLCASGALTLLFGEGLRLLLP
jgi:putative tricarboxylic transport membrane protein